MLVNPARDPIWSPALLQREPRGGQNVQEAIAGRRRCGLRVRGSRPGVGEVGFDLHRHSKALGGLGEANHKHPWGEAVLDSERAALVEHVHVRVPDRGPLQGDLAIEPDDDRRQTRIGTHAHHGPRFAGLQTHPRVERLVLEGSLPDRAAGQRALDLRQRLVHRPDHLDPGRDGTQADPWRPQASGGRGDAARLGLSALRGRTQAHRDVTQPDDRLTGQVGGLCHQEPVIEALRHEKAVGGTATGGPEDGVGDPDGGRTVGCAGGDSSRGGTPATATEGLRMEFPGELQSTQKRGRHSGWSRGPGSRARAQCLWGGR